MTAQTRRAAFNGPLTAETLPIVYDLFKTLLTRGPYIHIAAYEYRDWQPEVRTGCVAEKVTTNDGEHTTGVMVVDDGYVWGPYVSDVDYMVINDREIRYQFRTPEGKRCWVVIIPFQDGGVSDE